MRLVRCLLDKKLSKELSIFKTAKMLIVCEGYILRNIDAKKRNISEPVGVDVYNVNRAKSQFYHLCRVNEPLFINNDLWKELELLFYKAPTQESRVHLIYDMIDDYDRIKFHLDYIHPTFPYNRIEGDRRAERQEIDATIRKYLREHDYLPDLYLRYFLASSGKIYLFRESEVYDILELKERNKKRIEEIEQRAMSCVSSFVELVERMADIYGIDLQSIQIAYSRNRNKLEMLHKIRDTIMYAGCFSDYLQVEDKDAIINKLRRLPSDLPPKMYGAIITVMVNNGIMRPIADGERSAIYRALCSLYEDDRKMGSRQAVTKYICKEPLSDLDIASAEDYLR
ncbi:hypothetical protein [uncultured Alistipes sp.]|uniref:hypothetical protein n=1 Tax=uncultured Alistipes sp. TaxID=538949 RepID=UPI00265E20A3|nr:hypothetical protein [uncultured Alistipes sp.]